MTDDTVDQRKTIQLADGRSFVLRPLVPDDLDALRRAFQRLAPDEIEYRFFYPSRELPASVAAQVRNLDPDVDAAFVVDDAGEIRAVAELHVTKADGRKAEFAIIVGRAVSGQGLGVTLMRRLLAEAHRRDLDSLYGYVRADNERMLELCRTLGAEISQLDDDASVLCVAFRP